MIKQGGVRRFMLDFKPAPPLQERNPGIALLLDF
jgi:hypothetical protein